MIIYHQHRSKLKVAIIISIFASTIISTTFFVFFKNTISPIAPKNSVKYTAHDDRHRNIEKFNEQSTIAKKEEEQSLIINSPTPKSTKTFPAQQYDSSAAVLYDRIAKTGPSPQNSGDVSSFSRIMEKCWSVEAYDRMARSSSPETDAKTHGAAEALAQSEREANASLCSDLPADAQEKADEWTAYLAERGVPQSMFDYATRTLWVKDPMNSLKDPARVIEYRKNTLTYLNSLIDSGYPDALVAMGSIKLNPVWGDPDPTSAWAYMYAAAKARGKNEIEATLLSSIDSKVPSGQRENAILMSETLIRRCCVK